MGLKQLSVHEIISRVVEKRLTTNRSPCAINRSLDARLGIASGFAQARVRA